LLDIVKNLTVDRVKTKVNASCIRTKSLIGELVRMHSLETLINI